MPDDPYQSRQYKLALLSLPPETRQQMLRGQWKPVTMREARDSAIVAAYQEGRTLRECGQAFNLGFERIRQILIARGVPRRAPHVHDGSHSRVERVSWVCPVCSRELQLTPLKASRRKRCSRACNGDWAAMRPKGTDE